MLGPDECQEVESERQCGPPLPDALVNRREAHFELVVGQRGQGGVASAPGNPPTRGKATKLSGQAPELVTVRDSESRAQ